MTSHDLARRALRRGRTEPGTHPGMTGASAGTSAASAFEPRCVCAVVATTAVLAAGIALHAMSARAQGASAYPSKPVRVVVPFSPGASTDTVARLLGQRLADAWGQQFIVDNRPGAGGALGAELVARAEPDGYTLLVTNPGPSINSILLRRKPAYRFEDFAPIVYIGSAPLILVANPKLPAANVKELIAYAKANPGKVSWGSSGINSNPHAALEVLKSVGGFDIVHVPYKGSGPALADTIGGQIQGLYTTTVTAEAAIRGGRVKVLGVAGPRRSPVIPDVPTLSEQGIQGADNLLWMGMVTRAGVPRPIVDKLNQEVNRLLRTPEIQKRFRQLGLDPEGGSPEDFAELIRTQAKMLSTLIASGTLQPE